MKKVGVRRLAASVVAVGLVAALAMAAEEDHKGHHGGMMMGSGSAPNAGTADCAACAGGMQKKADDLIAALDAATKAVEAGEKDKALAELAKAKTIVTDWKKSCEARMAAKPIVNQKCPIMGTAIDPAKVPANLTRIHKGQKVGFCCGGCPAKWDALTEAEKDAKLKAAITSAPPARPMERGEHH